jgi:hypothetical protein
VCWRVTGPRMRGAVGPHLGWRGRTRGYKREGTFKPQWAGAGGTAGGGVNTGGRVNGGGPPGTRQRARRGSCKARARRGAARQRNRRRRRGLAAGRRSPTAYTAAPLPPAHSSGASQPAGPLLRRLPARRAQPGLRRCLRACPGEGRGRWTGERQTAGCQGGKDPRLHGSERGNNPAIKTPSTLREIQEKCVRTRPGPLTAPERQTPPSGRALLASSPPPSADTR